MYNISGIFSRFTKIGFWAFSLRLFPVHTNAFEDFSVSIRLL